MRATESSSCSTVAARSPHSSIAACTRFRSPGARARFARASTSIPTLYAYSTRLLAALEWTGLAMVEFKVGEDGPKLMEINGRVWGSLPLAVKSGVDFPARMAELYLAGPPKNGRPADTAYRLGVRSRNLDLEVVWIASTLRGRRGRRLVFVPPRREGVEAAIRLLNPKDGFDILSREDPRPGMAELAGIAAKLRRKVRS